MKFHECSGTVSKNTEHTEFALNSNLGFWHPHKPIIPKERTWRSSSPDGWDFFILKWARMSLNEQEQNHWIETNKDSKQTS